MIVVLVPQGKPPAVFQMTRPQFVRMVNEFGESGNYLATLPPWRAAGEFEQAWLKYTGDMKAARQFADVAGALRYYEHSRDTLSTAEHARILKILHEIRDAA